MIGGCQTWIGQVTTKEDFMDAQEKVLDTMKKAGKPMRPGDVATATGLDGTVVSKAIADLKKAGKIHSPKKCFYAPAE